MGGLISPEIPESLEVIQERVCSVCVAAHGKMDETVSFRSGRGVLLVRHRPAGLEQAGRKGEKRKTESGSRHP